MDGKEWPQPIFEEDEGPLNPPADDSMPPLDSLRIDEVEPPSTPLGARSANFSKSPRVSRRANSPRRWGTKDSNLRARAEEITTDFKVVPKIKASPGDFFTIDIELESWFYMSGVSVEPWLDSLKTNASSEVLRNILLPDKTFHSVAEVRDHILDRCRSVLATPDWVSMIKIAEFNSETLLLLLLATAIHDNTPLRANGVDILVCLLGNVAALRWDVDDESNGTFLSRLFFLSRLAILATFGDANALKSTRTRVWQQSGIEFDAADVDNYASPINYASFLEEIHTRYPSYANLDDDVEGRMGSRLKHMNQKESDLEEFLEPSELVHTGNLVIPFVPESIVEACALYKSRVRLTPAILQLYDEYQQQTKPVYDIPEIEGVWDLYSRTQSFQKSLIHVVIDYSIRDTISGPGTHAAISVLWHLLRWFECAHILMFENLAALIFDCQFHLFAHLFCSKHTQIQQYVLEDFPSSDFWKHVGRLEHYDGEPLETDNEPHELLIDRYNKYNLQTFTHLMGVCRLMTAGKTQRLLVSAELPVDPYKYIFGVYERELWLQTLQYLKSQVPFTGRRWRYLNMELISAIYLHVPSEIDDNWLSGADVSGAMKSAPHEEESLRTMIISFNKRIKEGVLPLKR